MWREEREKKYYRIPKSRFDLLHNHSGIVLIPGQENGLEEQLENTWFPPRDYSMATAQAVVTALLNIDCDLSNKKNAQGITQSDTRSPQRLLR